MRKNKTIPNKIYSLALIGIGILSFKIDGDASALVFFSMLAIPMFFAKRSWIS